MGLIRTTGYVVVFFFISAGFSYSQAITKMEFRNQPVTVILSLMAEAAGVTIIPDNTVRGNASYYITEMPFEEALTHFLKSQKLHYQKQTGTGKALYYVSKLQIEYDENRNKLNITTDDIDIPTLVRNISQKIGKTILFDPLPSDDITIHSQNISPDIAIRMTIERHPDYELISHSDYYYIKKKNITNATGEQKSTNSIRKNGENYDIKFASARFFDVVKELFDKAQKEYIFLFANDTILKDINVSGKNFEESLRIILELGNTDSAIHNNIYYIFQINNKEILNNYKKSEIIPLKYITTTELPQLLPPHLSSSAAMKLNNEENLVILSGSINELKAIKDFLLLIDLPLGDMEYFKYTFQAIDTEKIQSLLPQKYQRLSPIIHKENNSVIFRIPKGTVSDLRTYLDVLDKTPSSIPVTLRYIRSDTLQKNLPPSIGQNHIALTSNPSLILFTGPEEKFRQFSKELAIIDTPVPQIRYDLLIIQYQESIGNTFDFTASATKLEGSNGAEGFSGVLGNLLNVSFDTVSKFGIQFALDLNMKISESLANVMADTTLNGLSGQEVKFQNTDTFRKTEPDWDEQGNERPGITRELSSGLFLNIKGWVSGDGMITMDISSTISKRGTASSEEKSALPPTSERIINTHVRTRAGQPVIIGGLIQQERNTTLQRTPILGYLPLLGKVFTSETERVENTELAIYIVPSVEYSLPSHVVHKDQIRKLYHTYISGWDK